MLSELILEAEEETGPSWELHASQAGGHIPAADAEREVWFTGKEGKGNYTS